MTLSSPEVRTPALRSRRATDRNFAASGPLASSSGIISQRFLLMGEADAEGSVFMVMLLLIEMLDLGLLEDGWREKAGDDEVDCLLDLLLFGTDATRSLLKKMDSGDRVASVSGSSLGNFRCLFSIFPEAIVSSGEGWSIFETSSFEVSSFLSLLSLSGLGISVLRSFLSTEKIDSSDIAVISGLL